jgi:hypothetical protein
MDPRETLYPGRRDRLARTAWSLAYAALALISFLHARSVPRGDVDILRRYDYWSVKLLMALLAVAGGYGLYVTATSMFERRFPAEGTLLIGPTIIRRGHAVIVPTVLLMILAATCLAVPIFYFYEVGF